MLKHRYAKEVVSKGDIKIRMLKISLHPFPKGSLIFNAFPSGKKGKKAAKITIRVF